MFSRHPKLTTFFGILGVVAIFWLAGIFLDPYYNQNILFGVSFDPENAGSLHLDTVQTFHTIVQEWKFKYIRMPVHWDKVEKKDGQYDFSETDYYMNEAAKVGAHMTLAIGNKTPRWPECHTPAWALKLNETEYYRALDDYIHAVVVHYRNHPALEIWQVENEPFLSYGGECRAISVSQLKVGELAQVKSLDHKHPTLVTDSGELGTWVQAAALADYFGTTLYRVVWNPKIGYWNYDWVPPVYYRVKLWLAGRHPSNSFISELQAEPWPPNEALADTPYAEQQKSMSLDRLKKNIDYAHHVGFARVYLWGAEWWNWLKVHGYNEIPDYVATLNK